MKIDRLFIIACKTNGWLAVGKLQNFLFKDKYRDPTFKYYRVHKWNKRPYIYAFDEYATLIDFEGEKSKLFSYSTNN